ncbi:MAG TPA: carbohydrate ABC transporter permease [Chloroflexia bacterium]|nr:carbohydrate ABC transporter permease [Chloroflexia bacterium]
MILIGLALAAGWVPLGWAGLAALGLQPAGGSWVGALTLDNFAAVTGFEPAFGAEFAYTLAVAGLATLLTVAAAFPAAYRLAQVRAAWPGRLMPGLLVLAVSPAIAYGLPLAAVLRGIGLYGTFAGLVLASTAAQLPLALWLLRGYLAQQPPELAEAARLEGAGWLTTLLQIGLPLAVGGIGATAVLVFVLDWNLFVLPSLLTAGPPLVLPLALRDFFAFERDLDWPTAAAALLLTLGPALALALAAARTLDRLVVRDG